MTLLIILLFGSFMYFLPTMVGLGKPHGTAVFIVNLFLGWTFLGWVVSLAWAALPGTQSNDRSKIEDNEPRTIKFIRYLANK